MARVWCAGVTALAWALVSGAGEVRLPAEGVVKATRLNVRLRPEVTAPVLGQVAGGTRVVVHRIAARWCEISYPTTLGVWVRGDMVRAEDERADLSSRKSYRAAVVREGARIRSSPSLRGTVLAELPNGEALTVTGSFNDWLRVAATADLCAYVHADYVSLEPPREGSPAQGSGGDARAPEVGVEEASAPGASAPSALPPAAGARIGEAEGLLAAEGLTFLETRHALILLDEAMSLEGLSDAEREAVTRRVRAVVASLPPARWLELFEEAEAHHVREVENIDRVYGDRVREAAEALEEAPAVVYTAQGVLRPPVPGSDRYRLLHGNTLLHELDAGGEDLSAFVGRHVGVVGERVRAAGPGGPSVVEMLYVEETGPRGGGGD